MSPSTLIVFGGSFNPPHVAHLAIAEAAADSVESSRVMWMPAATPPHKQNDADLASAEHRLAMTRLAIEGNGRFEVSDMEIRRGDVSFTVDTLRVLADANPDAELALLLGGDSLVEFPSWREPEAILELARLLVYRRPGAHEDAIPNWVMERVTFIDALEVDVSSTELRQRIREGRSVQNLVPKNVIDYVNVNALYR